MGDGWGGGGLTLRRNADGPMHRHGPTTPVHTIVPLLGNGRTPKPVRNDGRRQHRVHDGDEPKQDPMQDRVPRFAARAPAPAAPAAAGDLEQHDGHGRLAPGGCGEAKGASDMVEEDESLGVGVGGG